MYVCVDLLATRFDNTGGGGLSGTTCSRTMATWEGLGRRCLKLLLPHVQAPDRPNYTQRVVVVVAVVPYRSASGGSGGGGGRWRGWAPLSESAPSRASAPPGASAGVRICGGWLVLGWSLAGPRRGCRERIWVLSVVMVVFVR